MEVIWAYNGKHRTLSHYWRGRWDEFHRNRISLCGRRVKYTGDDGTCPQNEKQECRDCNAIALYEGIERRIQFSPLVVAHNT